MSRTKKKRLQAVANGLMGRSRCCQNLLPFLDYTVCVYKYTVYTIYVYLLYIYIYIYIYIYRENININVRGLFALPMI